MDIKHFLKLLVVAMVLLITEKSSAQTVSVASIVPDSVAVWGKPMEVDMLGVPMVIRLRVIKHFGTTCVFDVELRNNGSKTLTATMGFLANDGLMYPATSGSITIKPGEGFFYKRERRVVLKRGIKNDALVCKNANPILGFASLKVK